MGTSSDSLKTLLGLEHPLIQAPMAGGPTTPELVAAVSNAGALGSLGAAYLFIFGIPDAEAVRALRASGAKVLGTATTVEEARRVERAGLDAVVAQGAEAGGHRGTFTVPFEQALVGTVALVPQVADAVRIPVIAAGGIMDGRGIVAVMALGAAGAQLGTAFLACDEAGTDAQFRRALEESSDASTTVTLAFSGKAARGLRNRFIKEWATREVPPFPVQNVLTRELRAAAARQGRPDLLNYWAGQGSPMIRRLPAGALVRALVRELDEVRARLAGGPPHRQPGANQ